MEKKTYPILKDSGTGLAKEPDVALVYQKDINVSEDNEINIPIYRRQNNRLCTLVFLLLPERNRNDNTAPYWDYVRW